MKGTNMVKYVWIIGGIALLAMGCLREHFRGEDCRYEVHFVMKDVPYAFLNEEIVGYQPYYTFIEQLDLYVFADQRPGQTAVFDFAYCREHPVITRSVDYNSHEALFIANLYSPREVSWSYGDGQLEAVFSIIDYEEPPVLLSAIVNINPHQDSVPVELRMLVSRVEIKLVNPPAWLIGLDVLVSNVAGTVSTNYVLGDTTHIQKRLFFDNQPGASYQFGVNTFPTYAGKNATLSITPIGVSETSPILVEDSRLNLLPGVITRVDIIYDANEDITIGIEVNGKWEIVDGGNIII